MPELPELQGHAERLTSEYSGAVVQRFVPLSFTALKTFSPVPEAAVGCPLQRVSRRGKYLLLHVDHPDQLTFVVHLMQGGRLKPDPKVSKRPRDGVARWFFGHHPTLLLTEPGTERKAGVWVVAGDALGQEPLLGLGPEADQVDAEQLVELFTAHRMRLHTFLRNQSIIAGLGRRLANEICHRARLSPFAATARLQPDDANRVAAAIRELVAEGLEAERTRTAMSAAKDRPAAVHARTGQPCPVCGQTVRAVEYRDYTVNYCPSCQTGGKILADNTTSKFLK